MPKYALSVVVNGSLQATGITLQVTGSHNSNTNVKYAASPTGPWTDFGGQIARHGHGSGDKPAHGDTLALNGNVGGYTLDGTATYDPPGKPTNGYYGDGLPQSDGDWEAVTDGR